ncbi:hypothetical protein STAS_12992 [Striga asiatica]|uniref:Uncharacterized protein n=1 Tax=Striga asiatica TaxID=4170 RepID=A0A5A7PUX6_STRAF|nr:hypothetical protein STAS_12992 [Striga asiatica]
MAAENGRWRAVCRSVTVWCVCVVVLPGTILRDAGREDISDAAGVTYVDRQVQAPPCVSPEETNFSSNLSGGGRWIKKGGAGTGVLNHSGKISRTTSFVVVMDIGIEDVEVLVIVE